MISVHTISALAPLSLSPHNVSNTYNGPGPAFGTDRAAKMRGKGRRHRENLGKLEELPWNLALPGQGCSDILAAMCPVPRAEPAPEQVLRKQLWNEGANRGANQVL